MLFHVDMIYLAKQAKRDVEKSFEMRTETKSNNERDFFYFGLWINAKVFRRSIAPPQPLAQPFAPMRYRCKYQVSSTRPNILEVYIIYLHVYMCQYAKVIVKL